MLELLSGDWRVFPATLLLIGGVLLASYGFALVYRAIHGQPRFGPANSLILLRGFRIAVIGIAIANVGAAWMWLVLWPLVFALVFIGEEMLEISFMIATVRQSQRGPVSFRRNVPPRGSLPVSR